MRQVEQGFGRVNSAIGFARTALGAFGVGIGVTGLASLGKSIIATSDEYAKLAGRIRLAIGEQESLAAVQASLLAVSQATRQDLSVSSELFARLALNLKDTGTSTQELISLTETLGQAVAISGASTTEASAGLLQLSQGLASGVLRGEELNSILEQTPRIAQAIAAGMDVPIGKLRELGKAGALTSEVVLSALQEQAPAIAREFAKVPITVEDAMTKVRNSFTVLVGGTDQATGSTRALASALSDLADTLGSPAVREGFTAFVAEGVKRFSDSIKEFQRIAGGVAEFSRSFVEFKDQSLAAVQELVKGVEEFLGNRLQAAFDAVAAPIQKTIDLFRGMYDAVVGQSYVPDMLSEIQNEFARLEGVMVGPAREATDATNRAFGELASPLVTRAVDRFGDTLTDTFEEIYSGGVASFSDLAELIKDIFIRLSAEMTTLAIFNPQALFSSLSGGGGVTPGLPGAGPGGITGFNPAAAGANWGGIFASGALGALGGSVIAPLLFGGKGQSQLGGGLGGALGAGAGFAFGGPIGGLIGGLGGSLLGGLGGSLFGGSEDDNEGDLRFATGRGSPFDPGAFGSLTISGENSFAGPLRDLIQKFDQGVSQFLTARQRQLAARSVQALAQFEGRFLESDPSAGFTEILKQRAGAVLKGAFPGARTAGVLEGAGSVDEIGRRVEVALQTIAKFNELTGKSATPVQQLNDAIAAIKEQFGSIRGVAKALGLDIGALDAAMREQIKVTRESFVSLQEQQRAARHSFTAQHLLSRGDALPNKTRLELELQQLDFQFDAMRQTAQALGANITLLNNTQKIAARGLREDYTAAILEESAARRQAGRERAVARESFTLQHILSRGDALPRKTRLQLELQQLDLQFDAMRRTAQELGANIKLLNRTQKLAAQGLRQDYIAEIKAERAARREEAAARREELRARREGLNQQLETLSQRGLGLRETFDNLLAPLRALQTELLTTGASPAATFEEIQRQFFRVQGQALTGNIAAIQQLPELGRALVQAAEAFGASPLRTSTIETVQAAIAAGDRPHH